MKIELTAEQVLEMTVGMTESQIKESGLVEGTEIELDLDEKAPQIKGNKEVSNAKEDTVKALNKLLSSLESNADNRAIARKVELMISKVKEIIAY